MPIDRNNAQYITGAIYKPTQTSAPGVWDLDDQANNIAKNLWPLPPSAITRSLRINQSDSAYLNRTFTAAGNRKLWTYSLWAKKNNPTATSTLISARTGNNDDYAFFYWSSTGNLYFLQGRVGANDDIRTSVPVFRDPSAWYHFVIIYDSDNSIGADRIQAYVNGSKVTWSIGTGPMAQGFSSGWVNYNGAHEIGRKTNYQTDYSSDFMIAEVNFIDGQSVAATNFAETDAQTGVWIPKRYSGTYGTNGFRLAFANNSSTTALGYDSSGQGNNWTTNNFSVTPGAGNDVLLDVPSMYNTDTGLGGEVLGNYATLNPLDVQSTVTLSNGNLDVSGGDNIRATIACPTTGKWYFEYTKTNATNAGNLGHVGIFALTCTATQSLANGTMLYRADGGLYENNVLQSITYASYTTGDVIGVAIDCDAGNISYYKNGVLQGTRTFVAQIAASQAIPAGRNNSGQTSTFNFGQRPFAYPAPSGYKALCTTNLPAPAIGQTSSNQADNHFAAVTYTGNGGTQTISTLDFQPDLIWIKRRDSNWSHAVYDSIRGAGSLKALSTNSADAEGVFNADTTYGYLSSFNNNGFTVVNGSTGGYTNLNNATYVAWCWNAGGSTVTNTSGTITSQVRANQRAGFSIVTYTGTGANATVGHGLGVTPSMIILKNRFSSAQGWTIWFTGFTANEYLVLNSTAAKATYSGQWSALPTATTIGLSSEVWTNGSGNSMVGYCWAAIPGYSAFGSYTGNGSSDGPFVYLGFRPRWLLVKNITFSPTNWILHDSARALTNPDGNLLLPDQSGAEAINSSVDYIDFLANGFKVRGNGEAQNRSGSTHIYAAFAETPARLSTAR
jgi:predicted RecA/RadA family phage recombinase